jgi:hypothetical protein
MVIVAAGGKHRQERHEQDSLLHGASVEVAVSVLRANPVWRNAHATGLCSGETVAAVG